MLYLIIIVLGLFGEAFVRNRIIISGDATATAANVRSMESLWRKPAVVVTYRMRCGAAAAADADSSATNTKINGAMKIGYAVAPRPPLTRKRPPACKCGH